MPKVALGLLLCGLASPAFAEGCLTGWSYKAEDADAVIAKCSGWLEQAKGAERARILRDRATVYLTKEDIDRALADLDESARLDPQTTSTFYDRAYIYRFKRRDLGRAISDLSRAVALDPKNEYYLDSRAELYAETGQLEMAGADLDAALASDPDTRTVLLVRRGDIWRLRGDYARAIVDYEASLKADPTYQRASLALSETRAILALGSVLAGPNPIAPDRFRRASVQKIGSLNVELWTLDGKPDHCALSHSYAEPAQAFARSAKGFALTAASSKWNLGANVSYPVTVVLQDLGGTTEHTSIAIGMDKMTVGIAIGDDPAFVHAWQQAISFDIRAANGTIQGSALGGVVPALEACWEGASEGAGSSPFEPAASTAPAPKSNPFAPAQKPPPPMR